MSAESRRWKCLVCKEAQESVDHPRLEVCEACLHPVADKLCREALKVPVTSPGIDREFWMRKADALLGAMLPRWKHG